MPSSPLPLVEPVEPPFFPAPPSSRPVIRETTSSDTSITTVSSYASHSSDNSATSFSTEASSTSSLEHPYATLVFVDRPTGSSPPSHTHHLHPTADGFLSDSSSSRSSSFGANSSEREDVRDALAPVREGVRWTSAPSAPLTSSPTLLHTLGRLSLDLPSPLPGHPPHSSTYPPGSAPSYPPSASMSRSRSANHRPSSSGTNSTSHSTSSTSTSTSSSSAGSSVGSALGSSRRWVRDSDASSVCSGGSASRTSGVSADSEPCTCGDRGHEPGEVFRVSDDDGIEFLDPRPEPAGATLTINRDNATQVVLTVMLPGFSLDNITVAMRRGHKVHIVADKYTEEGGHFEKLVSLGSDVVSAAPRAEFNGTELRVYVQRRPPRAPTRSGSRSSSSSRSSATTPTSAAPVTGPSSKPKDDESPVVTRTTAKGALVKGAGPEAAKAAAKQAKEEAALRAKEQAKTLPKVGRRIAFKSALLGRPATPVPPPPPPVPLPSPPREAESVKGKEREALSVNTADALLSRSPTLASSVASSSSFASSASSSPSSVSSSSQPVPAEDDIATSPTRPKLRSGDLNLTLRPREGASFVQAATEAADAAAARRKASSLVEADRRSETGLVTPKGERSELSFESL